MLVDMVKRDEARHPLRLKFAIGIFFANQKSVWGICDLVGLLSAQELQMFWPRAFASTSLQVTIMHLFQCQGSQLQKVT